MAMSPMNRVLHHLRKAAFPHDGAGLTDGQLLGAFLDQRGESAFAALVRRHGPMVWGICRRVLSNHHDAEDAFQATFLVLVRKAASVDPPEMVGNWLYGVAHQTARKARAITAKRQAREKQMTDLPEVGVKEPDRRHGLEDVLHQELGRLPEKYRVAIVLCDLEGRTRKDVARQLGVPDGTLAARLARGRAMLAKRLARHGFTGAVGSALPVVMKRSAWASVPASVMCSTIRVGLSGAGGRLSTGGLASPSVTALTEGVLKTMLLKKVKTTIGLLVLGIAAVGLAGTAGVAADAWTARTQAVDPPPAAAAPTQANPSLEETLKAILQRLDALEKRLAHVEGSGGPREVTPRSGTTSEAPRAEYPAASRETSPHGVPTTAPRFGTAPTPPPVDHPPAATGPAPRFGTVPPPADHMPGTPAPVARPAPTPAATPLAAPSVGTAPAAPAPMTPSTLPPGPGAGAAPPTSVPMVPRPPTGPKVEGGGAHGHAAPERARQTLEQKLDVLLDRLERIEKRLNDIESRPAPRRE
jgi:RNA polymerase sigma factor (sigma-70 family)